MDNHTDIEEDFLALSCLRRKGIKSGERVKQRLRKKAVAEGATLGDREVFNMFVEFEAQLLAYAEAMRAIAGAKYK